MQPNLFTPSKGTSVEWSFNEETNHKHQSPSTEPRKEYNKPGVQLDQHSNYLGNWRRPEREVQVFHASPTTNRPPSIPTTPPRAQFKQRRKSTKISQIHCPPERSSSTPSGLLASSCNGLDSLGGSMPALPVSTSPEPTKRSYSWSSDLKIAKPDHYAGSKYDETNRTQLAPAGFPSEPPPTDGWSIFCHNMESM